MSLSRYKTDCLFLLVGTNPLPNYVASLLLVNDGGKVILLHSRGTGIFAKNIEKAIRDKKVPVTIEMWEIDESDGVRIIQKLKKEILPFLNAPSSVGLNYTGGTKSMAVHAYRALENYACEKEIPAIFSYLDARTLSIVFIFSDGSPSKREPVRGKVKISIEELLALHGYRIVSKEKNPFFPAQAKKLVHLYYHLYYQKNRFREEMEREFLASFDKGYTSLNEVADGEKKDRGRVRDWIARNQWLEDYVFWSVQEIAECVGIHDLAWEIKPMSTSASGSEGNLQQRDFEVDIVAMRGYQLYAISCTTLTKKSECKKKLFEAYIRASQMGGDEARAGLVCCFDDPLLVRREVEEDWFAEGRVQVFGREDLIDLPEKLRDWFEST
jgi:hypothetical protein